MKKRVLENEEKSSVGWDAIYKDLPSAPLPSEVVSCVKGEVHVILYIYIYLI